MESPMESPVQSPIQPTMQSPMQPTAEIKSTSTMATNLITLNVGGTLFHTTRVTLERSSYFKALLQDDTSTGTIFIDRDPSLFAFVLNHLRGGASTIPMGRKYIAFRQECDYFGVGSSTALTPMEKQWIYTRTSCILYRGEDENGDDMLLMFGTIMRLWGREGDKSTWTNQVPSDLPLAENVTQACDILIESVSQYGWVMRTCKFSFERSECNDPKNWWICLERV